MALTSLCSKEIQVERTGVMQAELPVGLGIINILPQVRKTMTINGDMDDLVESILNKGQKVRGKIIALKPRAAGQYLKEVNRLWGTNHQLRKLKKCEIDEVEYYLILVYGHRRLKACSRAAKRLAEGEKSAVFDGRYSCDIHFNMTFDEAFSDQLVENLYVPPPKHEEVAALWRFWRYRRKTNPDLTVAAFAKEVGRRAEAVREMLRFCSLPESVQEMIRPDTPGGKASFSLLIQVARKAEAFEAFGRPIPEEDLVNLVNLLVVKKKRADEYSKQVTEEIRCLHDEQKDLFADMVQPLDQRIIRKTAAAGIVRTIVENIHYLGTINALMRSGGFGGLSPYAEESELDTQAEYSPDSPSRIALRFIEVLKGAVPDLAEMLQRDSKSATKLQAALADLEIEEAVFSAVVR